MLSPTSKSNRNSGTGTEEKSGQMQLNSPSHLSSEDPKRTTTCTKLQQGKMQVVITVSHYSVDNLISTCLVIEASTPPVSITVMLIMLLLILLLCVETYGD